MTVSSATSAPAASYANIAAASSPATRTAKKAMGQEDFLKLLATQFQTQDPMKPMDDTAFIAQMAQFSALEQSSSMVKEMALLRADQSLLTAGSYLGRNVTVQDGAGQTVTGPVAAVDNDPASGVTITIGGKSYPLSSVRRVEPFAPPSPGLPSAPARPAA